MRWEKPESHIGQPNTQAPHSLIKLFLHQEAKDTAGVWSNVATFGEAETKIRLNSIAYGQNHPFGPEFWYCWDVGKFPTL